MGLGRGERGLLQPVATTICALACAGCADEPAPPSPAPNAEAASSLVSAGWEKLPSRPAALPTSGVLGLAINANVDATKLRLWTRTGTTLRHIDRQEAGGWGAWANDGLAFPAGVTPDSGIAAFLRDDGITNLSFHGSNNHLYYSYVDTAGNVYPFGDSGGIGYGGTAWSETGAAPCSSGRARPTPRPG